MKDTIGICEKVLVYSSDGSKKEVLARIDTGANSNSIDSTLARELDLGPVIRTTMIRSANGQSIRPVLQGTIEIKHRMIKTTFNVADRSRMRYKMLIGRKTLKGFLIDTDESSDN